MAVEPFSDEQARVIVNLDQAYQVWMETLRTLNDLPYNMRIKEVSGREYLYEVTDRLGTMKSKGPVDPDKRAGGADEPEEVYIAARRGRSEIARQRKRQLDRAEVLSLRARVVWLRIGILRRCNGKIGKQARHQQSAARVQSER